jgi:hypothetical protein
MFGIAGIICALVRETMVISITALVNCDFPFDNCGTVAADPGDAKMYRLMLFCLIYGLGCKSNEPPPNSRVNVVAPGVRVNVQDDGRVSVKHPAGVVIVP